MTINDIAKLSTELLTRYYDNDVQPFFDCCHDDVLWMGPAENQIIRTKKALVEAFEKEENQLRFAVYNLTAVPCHICPNCTEVLMTFTVDTFWPDGSANRVAQRITLTWDVRRDKALIRVCHISNPIAYDQRDAIYPVHFLESYPYMTLYKKPSKKLSFSGINKSILYTSPEEILYMESVGNHTLIHMATQTFECAERLSAIDKRMKDTFVRCHASYLVNPSYVRSIERFALTMENDQKIPVPEKKYTTVKALLLKK